MIPNHQVMIRFIKLSALFLRKKSQKKTFGHEIKKIRFLKRINLKTFTLYVSVAVSAVVDIWDQ